MLDEMYPLAVQAGIPAEKYWLMTYDEIIVQVEANKRKKQEGIKEQISLDYRLAQLMTYAVNNPKKMPKLDKLLPNFDQKQEQTERVKLEPWELHKQMMMKKIYNRQPK